MKRNLIIVITAAFILALPLYSAWAGKSIPGTGDTALDLSLKQFNVDAKVDINLFADNMSTTFKVKRGSIDIMMKTHLFSPSDVYMALKLQSLSGKPLNFIIDEFNKSRGKGWGVTAKKLGIKPGSKAFHALKEGASITVSPSSGKGNDKAKMRTGNKGGGKGKNK